MPPITTNINEIISLFVKKLIKMAQYFIYKNNVKKRIYIGTKTYIKKFDMKPTKKMLRKLKVCIKTDERLLKQHLKKG